MQWKGSFNQVVFPPIKWQHEFIKEHSLINYEIEQDNLAKAQAALVDFYNNKLSRSIVKHSQVIVD
jgi:hypothetical protein